jgi:hypothetical protein
LFLALFPIRPGHLLSDVFGQISKLLIFLGVRNLISGSFSLSDELILKCIMCVRAGRFDLCVPMIAGASWRREAELTLRSGAYNNLIDINIAFLAWEVRGP